MADRAGAHRVVVVGGGVGGLVAAIELARQGMPVTLLERAAQTGGKLSQTEVGGQHIDAGPTVFTMRWVFEEIFAAAGTRLTDALQLQPMQTLARHAWTDGSRLDLFADPQHSAAAIGDFAGAAEARRFLAFCRQARDLYAALEGPYIRSQRPSLPSMIADLGIGGSLVLWRLGLFRSLWASLSRHFRDPRLRQLFGRYATYCGSSPFAAPATLMLVAQVEMQGVWTVRGGMVEIGRALSRLATQLGVTVRTGAEVGEIELHHGKVCGVRLSDGETLPADSVVFNGDVAALAAGLLGEGVRAAVPAIAPPQRSLSAMTWCMVGRPSGMPLVHHNVLFDEDYASEFRDIFGRGRLPQKGTVYLCAQDRGDDDAPRTAPERLFALVNAPAIGDLRTLEPGEMERCHERMLRLLERCGLSLETTPERTVTSTPQDFERRFPATGGSLYGMATHGWLSSFRRPSAESRVPGLYLAGGSVHPGAGVPMAALSGRLAAATLMAHLGLTSRSQRVRISGGMSMP